MTSIFLRYDVEKKNQTGPIVGLNNSREANSLAIQIFLTKKLSCRPCLYFNIAVYISMVFSNTVSAIEKLTFCYVLKAPFFKYIECRCGSDQAL